MGFLGVHNTVNCIERRTTILTFLHLSVDGQFVVIFIYFLQLALT